MLQINFRKQMLAAAIVLAILATSVPAGFVPLTGLVPLAEARERFVVGDKLFGNFQLDPGIAVGTAYSPNYESLKVQGGYDQATGDIGLRFVTALVAGSNSIADLNFSYRVETIPPPGDTPRHMIKDVRFIMTGVTALNGGLMTASETVLKNDWTVLANLGLTLQGNNTPPLLRDGQEFQPVPGVWVHNDILVMGGGNPAGIAHVSEFYQFFSQVPEPVSLSMLLLGGLALVRRRK